MSEHRFRVGQSVHLLLGIFHPDNVIECTVVQLLPIEGDGFKYRVRGDLERHVLIWILELDLNGLINAVDWKPAVNSSSKRLIAAAADAQLKTRFLSQLERNKAAF